MGFTLRNEDIVQVVDEIDVFLTDTNTEKHSILRTRLMSEELLLTYQKELGAEAAVELRREHHLFRDIMVLRIPGRSYDPFSDTEQDTVLHNLLLNVGVDPVWSYKNGCNCLSFIPERRRKISGTTWILLSVVLGFLLGFLAWLLPEDLITVVNNDVLCPLSETIMSFLSAVSAFLIFFSVINGVCGMGDMATFRHIGRKMIGKSMLTLLFFILLVAAVLLPFFRISTDGADALNLKELYDMLMDIVPDNMISPFSTGNTLQIIFLAICVGIALLALNLKLRDVSNLLLQLTELSQNIVLFVIDLLPIVIFINVFQIVSTRQLSILSSVYRYPLLVALACGVLLIVSILRVSLTKKISPLLLIRKLLPTFAIALSTASSIAALTSNMDTCKNRLGIHKDLTNVGVPLGQVIFMPGAMTEIFCAALCMGSLYDMPITVSWLATLALISFIMSIAMPPLPGATISCYMMVISQLGIPVEAITIIIAFDALIDRLSTSANVSMLQLELVQVAGSLDMLDVDTLRKE